MNELNFIFVWLAGWLVLSSMTNFTVIENVNGKYERRWGIAAAFLVFLPIFSSTFQKHKNITYFFIVLLHNKNRPEETLETVFITI